MKVQGACLCGVVTFEAEIDPNRVIVCHCTDCQNQTGAFRRIVPIDAKSFELRSGELKHYVKVAESGRRRSLAFCPECGTGIYGAPEGDAEEGAFSLRVGPIKDSETLVPVVRVWHRSAGEWVEKLSDLPCLDTQPGV